MLKIENAEKRKEINGHSERTNNAVFKRIAHVMQVLHKAPAIKK